MRDLTTDDAQLMRTIEEAADRIMAGLDRQRIPQSIALGIIGCVAGRLLDRLPPEYRTKMRQAFLAGFEEPSEAAGRE